MLKIAICLIFLGILILFIPASVVLAESEPNNKPDQANTLAVNGSDSGTMNSSTDTEDWWKITLPSDGALIIATLSVPALEIDNYIYDQDKTSQLASYLHNGSHPEDTTQFFNLKAGTYYIKSYAYSGEGSYTIKSRFIPSPLSNDSEPNDSAQVAMTLEINKSTTGHLGYYSLRKSDETDWWVVTVPSDGKLIIATNSDNTLEIDNYIYDQDKKSQIASYAYQGSHTWDTTYFNNLIPGKYYIKTYCYSGYGSYTIANTFIPAKYSNDTEPNDSLVEAVALTLNGSLTGHLGFYSLGKTDLSDWYKITIPSDGSLVIATLSDATLEIDNYIYDKNKKTQIASYAYSGSHTWDTTYFSNLTPGTYYVLSTNYAGYGSYTITNRFTPTAYANDSEPNDSIKAAKALSLNTVLTGHLGFLDHPFTDSHDYFSFVASAVMDSLFIRTDSDRNLEIDLNLYNSSGVNINHAGKFGTIEIITQTKLQPGTYYIDVFGYSGYGSYSMIVKNTLPGKPVVGIENESAKLPKDFKLFQNYPNPFNPETNISYSLAAGSNVKLKVYDILGNETAVLVNEFQRPGNYIVRFNAGKLPSGIYICKLEAGSFVDFKKIMLIK